MFVIDIPLVGEQYRNILDNFVGIKLLKVREQSFYDHLKVRGFMKLTDLVSYRFSAGKDPLVLIRLNSNQDLLINTDKRIGVRYQLVFKQYYGLGKNKPSNDYTMTSIKFMRPEWSKRLHEAMAELHWYTESYMATKEITNRWLYE